MRLDAKLRHADARSYMKPFFKLLVQTIDYDLWADLPLFCNNVKEIFEKLRMEQLLAIFVVEDELPIVLREI